MGAEFGYFFNPQWSGQVHIGFLWMTQTEADWSGLEIEKGGGRLHFAEYGVGANRYFADSGFYLGTAVAAVRKTTEILADCSDTPPLGWGVRFWAGIEMRLGDIFHLGGRAWLGIDKIPGHVSDDESITFGFQGSLSLY